jgi:membrane-anchored glycerophosphoryl diester phosphodiesterase (GDPDase)
MLDLFILFIILIYKIAAKLLYDLPKYNYDHNKTSNKIISFVRLRNY